MGESSGCRVVGLFGHNLGGDDAVGFGSNVPGRVGRGDLHGHKAVTKRLFERLEAFLRNKGVAGEPETEHLTSGIDARPNNLKRLI